MGTREIVSGEAEKIRAIRKDVKPVLKDLLNVVIVGDGSWFVSGTVECAGRLLPVKLP